MCPGTQSDKRQVMFKLYFILFFLLPCFSPSVLETQVAIFVKKEEKEIEIKKE